MNSRKNHPDKKRRPGRTEKISVPPATPRTKLGALFQVRWLQISLIFIVAFSVRFVFLVQQSENNPLFYYPVMDEEYHDQWAQAILSDQPFLDHQPYFRAPLYPWFLSLLYTLVGRDLFLARLVQIILGSLTAVMVYRFAALFVKPLNASLAGFIIALYGPLVYFDCLLLIPVLAVFLNTVFLVLLIQAMRIPVCGKRPFYWAGAGLACGLSAIARPNMLLFVPVICLYYFLMPDNHLRQLWKKAVDLCIFGVALALIITPVTIRNYIVSGDFVLIASQGGVNFYIGNNPQSDGKTAIVPGTRPDWWGGYEDSRALAISELGPGARDSDISRFYYQKAFAYIKSDFRSWSRLMGKKVLFLLGSFEPSNNYAISFMTGFAPVYSFIPFSFKLLAPFGLTGLLFLLTRKKGAAILPLFLITYAFSIVLFFVTARYRLPLIPLLAVGVPVLLERSLCYIRQKNYGYLLMIVLTVGTLYVFIDRPGQPYHDVSQDHYTLGVHYASIGDTEKARHEYEKALQVNKKSDNPVYNLALLYEESGDVSTAKKLYQEALSRNPDNWSAAHRLSKLALREHDLQLALDWANKAVDAQPRDPENHYLQGHCFMAMGQYSDAEQSFQQCLDIAPHNLNCTIYLAVSFLEQNKVQPAVTLLKQVLAEDPDNQLARRFMSMLPPQ